MKIVRNTLYLIVILLLLQVIKSLLSKSGFASYFYWAMICTCLQYLLIAGSLLTFITAWLLRKKNSGKKKWMVSGSIVLALFIALEWLFTSWLDHPEHIPAFMKRSYKFYYDSYDRKIIQFERDHAVYDSVLFYKLRPGASFNYKNREFNNQFITNSLGTRDDENSVSAPEVICLGDSYIMGWGVDQEESVPQQLEKLSGMKILNAGVSSYGTAREMILLNKINTSALKFLVIQYCENDTRENDSYRRNNYKLEVSSQALFDETQRREEWSKKYFPGKHFFLITGLYIKHELNKIFPFFKPSSYKEESVKDESYQAELFLDVLCNAGINLEKTKVIVTMMDSYPYLHNDFLKQVKLLSEQSPYKEKLAALSIADVSGILDKNDFYKLDLHIKASGHKKIAEKIFEIMKPEQ